MIFLNDCALLQVQTEVIVPKKASLNCADWCETLEKAQNVKCQGPMRPPSSKFAILRCLKGIIFIAIISRALLIFRATRSHVSIDLSSDLSLSLRIYIHSDVGADGMGLTKAQSECNRVFLSEIEESMLEAKEGWQACSGGPLLRPALSENPEFRGPQIGGQIRDGRVWRFWGAPIFSPEVPKYLF